MVHAEGYDAIRFLTERLERAGKTAPYFHAASRPQIVEREATHRAISHAELVDVPIMIVHVSGREAMEQIRWAQQRGLKVYAETCPQYIALTAEDLRRPRHGHERRQIRLLAAAARPREPGGDLGGPRRRACSRPSRPTTARSATTTRRASSRRRAAPRFRWVPNGIPGVETRLPILFSEGVVEGPHLAQPVRRADRDQPRQDLRPLSAQGLDRASASTPTSRSGTRTGKETIRQEILHHGADYTPWEGFEVTGWPVMTMVRGETVAEEGRLVGRKGRGEILEREISPYAAAPA